MNVERIRRRKVTMFFVVWLIVSAVSMQTMSIEAVAGPYASCDYPADGAAIEGDDYPFTGDPTHIYTVLDFLPGEGAVKHTGYCSENYDDVLLRVQDANLGPPPTAAPYRYYVGLPIVEPFTDSLVRGVTYYWCVDETDAMNTTYPGDIWEFTILSYKASNPDPPNEAVFVDLNPLLTWTDGIEADEHDVYIGTNRPLVETADEFDTTGIYLGYVTTGQYQCYNLEPLTKYYWRVDAVSGRIFPGGGTIYKGDIWCFTTRGNQIFVDMDATGANNGSSWDNAFNYLQDALAVAWPGVEIRVAEGIYKPDEGAGITPGDREATFQLINEATIKGGYAGEGQPNPDARDISLYETILSGDLNGDDEPNFVNNSDNSYHVVTGSGTDETGVLDGFTITAGNAEGSWLNFKGGGMDSDNGSPTVTNCTFRDNWASRGGGMYNGNNSRPMLTGCTFMGNIALDEEGSFGGGMCNDSSSPVLNNCIFTRNLADVLIPDHGGGWGGGMFNDDHSSPTLTNCTFSENTALCSGGGMTNRSISSPTLSNCTFTDNLAKGYYDRWGEGGGMFNDNSSPALTNCTFTGNAAGREGGGINSFCSGPTITNCTFSGNVASDRGGSIYNYESSTAIANCTFSGNSSGEWGGGVCSTGSDVELINCTFAGNLGPSGSAVGCYSYEDKYPSNLELTNCILWDGGNEIYKNDSSIITVLYSDVQGGWPGVGNISSDPLFVDADGADNVSGTEDDDLRLLPDSPCVDAGDNTAVPPTVTTDLDGNPRIANGTVDMGAYEFQGPFKQCYYVDGVNGDDDNDGLSPETAFATIQKGIDTAVDGETVVVYPDVYNEAIYFDSKAITVKSAAEPAVLEIPGDYAVSLYGVEGPDSLLKNFIIRGSDIGIFIVGGSPTISNVTVVDNEFGIAAYAGAQPDISNSIIWDNTDGGLFQCDARYSCVQDGNEGDCNISIKPLFVDAAGGDYHLHSERGRHWPAHDVWVLDKVTSLCIDGGDPTVGPGNEPVPNGGRINMGAYGGTAYASMSEWQIEGDINQDYIVNMKDIAILANNWLLSSLDIPCPNDLDTTPPEPNPVIITIQAISPTSITMTAQEAYDESGVEYYFEALSAGGHDSGWLDEPNYTDVNLVFNTEYCYRIKARDTSDNYNETIWSPEVCAVTVLPPDTLPPEPDVTVWDPVADANGFEGYPREVLLDPFSAFDYGATMRAIDTDDVAPAGVPPSEVEYYFECVTDGGFDSGWRTVAAYPDEEERRTYTVKVGAKRTCLYIQGKGA